MRDFDPASREKLFALLRTKLGEEMTHDDFRIAYEDLYNFGLDRSLLTSDEEAILQKLFDVLVWYSPLPGDRAKYPQYRSEQDVELALQRARQELDLEV